MDLNDGTRYKRIKNGGQEELEEKSIFQLIEIEMLDTTNVLYSYSLIEPLINSKDDEFKAPRRGRNEKAINFYEKNGYHMRMIDMIKSND